MNVSGDLRKLIMAGIGAVSEAAEKSQDMLERLAAKGEQAVNQGKVMNEQLRHEVKQALKDNSTVACEKPAGQADILTAFKALSAQERAATLEQLRAVNDAEDTDAE